MMSGPRIDVPAFKEGWAKLLGGAKAHFYFVVAGEALHSHCGQRFTELASDAAGLILLHPGTYPRCQRCSAKRSDT